MLSIEALHPDLLITKTAITELMDVYILLCAGTLEDTLSHCEDTLEDTSSHCGVTLEDTLSHCGVTNKNVSKTRFNHVCTTLAPNKQC